MPIVLFGDRPACFRLAASAFDFDIIHSNFPFVRPSFAPPPRVLIAGSLAVAKKKKGSVDDPYLAPYEY